MLLNYRADGTTFWNRFYIAPLHDGAGAVKFYVGCQYNVTTSDVDSDDDLDVPCDGDHQW